MKIDKFSACIENMSAIQKLKKYTEKSKIMTYVEKEIGDLYRIGKENGWDVPALVREAISEKLLQNETDLRRPADSD